MRIQQFSCKYAIEIADTSDKQSMHVTPIHFIQALSVQLFGFD